MVPSRLRILAYIHIPAIQNVFSFSLIWKTTFAPSLFYSVVFSCEAGLKTNRIFPKCYFSIIKFPDQLVQADIFSNISHTSISTLERGNNIFNNCIRQFRFYSQPLCNIFGPFDNFLCCTGECLKRIETHLSLQIENNGVGAFLYFYLVRYIDQNDKSFILLNSY